MLVYVNGAFVPRGEARVSIFDSGFVLGDGIWEGLRLVQGRIVSLEAHLDRLYEGATSIALDIGLSRAELTQALVVGRFVQSACEGRHRGGSGEGDRGEDADQGCSGTSHLVLPGLDRMKSFSITISTTSR